MSEEKPPKKTNRDERFHMRLTAEDRAVLQRAAELEGENISTMIRRAALKEARTRIARYGG